MRYNDPNIAKIISLLSHSKLALDAALEAAQEYAESDRDVTLGRDMLENDLEHQKDNPEMDCSADIERSKERLKEAEIQNIKTAAVLAVLAKNLENDLGHAGRVSDHFNKKVYPLGMSPL